MNHVNFVLLAQPRCGSNLLLRALAEHPQIRMIGEVLSPDPAVRADAWRLVNPYSWPPPRGEGYQQGQDAGEFFAQSIFSPGPLDNLWAFGFKLFYDDANFDDSSRTAWDYLLAHDIKVIHLTRKNLLDALVSQQVAERTGRFTHPVEDTRTPPPPLPPFVLDADACRSYFEHILARRAWIRQAFARHDVLEVEYESDLCADFKHTVRHVHQFLQTVPWNLGPKMVKLRAQPASAQVANFEELRQHFAGTEYREFFAETTRIAPRTFRSQPAADIPHTNFVVLGHPRCGSNLLVRALDEHPQVRVIGEVLARDEGTRNTAWQRVNPAAWKQPRGDGYRIGEDGGQFLQREIFADAPQDNFRAFGFKLFYEDARWDPKVGAAWDYLAASDVRVIHLIRRNLLLALISEEVALRTNRWFHLIEEKDKASSPLPPFALDPAACEQYFHRIAEWRVWTRERFGKHPFLTVEYESGLVADFRGATMQVYDFLGVVPWIVRPRLVKQQGVPASRQISNFEELRRHFGKSEFAQFFETADEGIQARA